MTRWLVWHTSPADKFPIVFHISEVCSVFGDWTPLFMLALNFRSPACTHTPVLGCQALQATRPGTAWPSHLNGIPLLDVQSVVECLHLSCKFGCLLSSSRIKSRVTLVSWAITQSVTLAGVKNALKARVGWESRGYGAFYYYYIYLF